eukprot:358307-Chlamydomonas_euryale.AAC.3
MTRVVIQPHSHPQTADGLKAPVLPCVYVTQQRATPAACPLRQKIFLGRFRPGEPPRPRGCSAPTSAT